MSERQDVPLEAKVSDPDGREMYCYVDGRLMEEGVPTDQGALFRGEMNDDMAEAVGLEWSEPPLRVGYQTGEGGHWRITEFERDGTTVRFQAPALAPIEQITVEVES